MTWWKVAIPMLTIIVRAPSRHWVELIAAFITGCQLLHCRSRSWRVAGRD